MMIVERKMASTRPMTKMTFRSIDEPKIYTLREMRNARLLNWFGGTIAGLLTMGISFYSHTQDTAKNVNSIPQTVYQKDVNEDGIKDVVIKTRGGNYSVYLGNSDGTFTPKDEVISKNKQDLENKIEINLKGLDAK